MGLSLDEAGKTLGQFTGPQLQRPLHRPASSDLCKSSGNNPLRFLAEEKDEERRCCDWDCTDCTCRHVASG